MFKRTALLSACVLMWPTMASACSCGVSRVSDAELRERAAVIATGTVVSIRQAPKYKSGFDRVKIKVISAEKPKDKKYIFVETPNNRSACGFPFRTGGNYSIMAFNETWSGQKRVTATICRTREISR